MNEYLVTLGEVISHSLEVKAESEQAAIELAKRLIGNEPDEMLKRKYDYAVETIGWDGYEETFLTDAA